MTTVGIVLLALVAIVVGLLASPVRVTMAIERGAATTSRWGIVWLFGLMRVGTDRSEPLPPDETVASVRRGRSADVPHPAAEPEITRDRDHEDHRATLGRAHPSRRKAAVEPHPRVVIAVLRSPGFVARAMRLVGSLAGRVKIERFRLHAAFGLDDPADTGVLYGLLVPLLVTARACRVDVDWCPIFDEQRGTLSSDMSIRVVPLAVATTVLAFVVSPSVVRALLAAVRARRG